MPPTAEGVASRIFLGPALRAQPDRRLVTLVRDGYESAFEEIVRRYRAPLGRYASRIVGGRAEDVTQDAFSKALLALRRDGAEIELRPWLYRIVRNTALNDLRDRPPATAVLGEAMEGGGDVSEEVERREEVAELLRRLGELPEPQRAAIVMRELEGLGHEEIAAALGVSGGAARQAIHRARTALRDAAGAAIPLPLLRVLIDHGGDAAVMGAGAGGVAAAGASIGGAGAGGALKLGLATLLIAGSVGTGLALEGNRQPAEGAARADAPAARASSQAGRRGESGAAGGPSRHSPGEGRRGASGEGRDDGGSGGDARHGGDAGSSPTASGDSNHSGPGSGGSAEEGHGPGERSGSDSGSSDDRSGGGELSDSSGSGSGEIDGGSPGESGSSGDSGSSLGDGSGSGEMTSSDDGSSGSESSGSGSSGSGESLSSSGDGSSGSEGGGTSGSSGGGV